jgi:hypothetical protein
MALVPQTVYSYFCTQNNRNSDFMKKSQFFLGKLARFVKNFAKNMDPRGQL